MNVTHLEIQNLIPGNYQVKAERSGFKAAAVTDVAVFVDLDKTAQRGQMGSADR
jgi:hypothetical protein